MVYLTKDKIKNALIKADIKKGDTVLVHSDIASFGTVENFSRKKVLEMFYEAFMEIIGSEGTLCTPAYFYEYGKDIPFDIELSPISKELGVFAKYINSLPNRKRSCHPITSIAAVGKMADYICEIKNRHAYGEDSVFDRLHKINAKIVILGTSNCPLTFLHFIEYRVGVPYRYNKLFKTPILSNGKLIFDSSFAFLRYMDLNLIPGKSKHWTTAFNKLIETNKAYYTDFLESYIFSISTTTLFDFIRDSLYENPYSLFNEAPNFVKGQYPFK